MLLILNEVKEFVIKAEEKEVLIFLMEYRLLKRDNRCDICFINLFLLNITDIATAMSEDAIIARVEDINNIFQLEKAYSLKIFAFH
ncbi:hypothetical protein H312_03137 [Anncaliia algerae PRA339]|uniref:Uncharacterized protein n=1 Tax=Anncaliia algerae PRA339 TaxID=1288291 RepID=A0A059EWS4_9MICR|nr:hypothetical protein H312_03137 [Anncaliia algerae PRA339]